MAEKGIPPDKLAWHLQRNAAAIEVWRGVTKQQRVNFGNDNEAEIRLQANQGNAGVQTYFVEWVSNQAQPLTATLTFEARMGNQVVSSDNVTFYRFQSVVIVIGGYTQDNPTLIENDAINDQAGIYRLATWLYRDYGYDVHVFGEHEQNAPRGDGTAYETLAHAANHHNQTRAIILGFSFGGGATHNLAHFISQVRQGRVQGQALPNNFFLAFTAYIDAIRHRVIRRSPPPEDRRPEGSQYHVAYFQTADNTLWLIRGAPTANADVNMDVNNPRIADRELWHSTIDDSIEVLQDLCEYIVHRANIR
ncbi:MAG: hypothetical protein RMI91_11000 [Gemmatales bacterium]|nr:hypothetical protein [Gemmatales bacterium]